MNYQNNLTLFFSTEDLYLDDIHQFSRVPNALTLPLHNNQVLVSFTDYIDLYEKTCIHDECSITDVKVFGSSYLKHENNYSENHNKEYLQDLIHYFKNHHKKENFYLYLFLHEKDLYSNGEVDNRMFNSIREGSYVWYITKEAREEWEIPDNCDVYLFQHEGVCPVVELLEKETVSEEDLICFIEKIQVFHCCEEADKITVKNGDTKTELAKIKEQLKNI